MRTVAAFAHPPLPKLATAQLAGAATRIVPMRVSTHSARGMWGGLEQRRAHHRRM